MSLTRTAFISMITFGVVLAIAAIALFSARDTAEADDVGDILDVCCAWNGELTDGDLTYSIAGGDSDVQAVVRAAVEDWETQVAGLTLTETGDTSASNIEIKFRNGGGQIQGQARRKFDDAGLVREVDIVVSGKAFGDPNEADTVGQIAKHEVGHGLGINHTNFNGDLMSPTVSGGSGTISDCDVDGVLAANEWFFPGGSGTPTQTSVSHVHCGPAPTPGPTPDPGDVEIVTVDSIACAVERNRLIYTIKIVDSSSQPVEAAVVSGTRLDPRGRLFTFEGPTDADGEVTFRAGRPGGGDHLITVQDVTGDGLDFGDPFVQICSI
ncbi:MAG: matrixin family metalloprotease [Chloroflexi bacterium]|nr:matrixin family metalloprotease [Chloroflexota bacterium]